MLWRIRHRHLETVFGHLKQNIRKALTTHQLKLIDTNRKLSFYASFRKDTRKTGWLDMINNPHHRIVINKFRLGNHKLRIETGRHTIPKTPINLRICTFCHSNEVENEIHFLFACQLYDGLRLKFFYDIADKYSLFNKLDINAKVLFLFNSTDPFVCRLTAVFVFQALLLGQEISFVK